MGVTTEIVFDIMPELGSQMGERTRKVVRKTCRAIKGEAKRSIEEGPKTGNIYTSGPAPLPHQASAAGEAPANWTGALMESIKYRTHATGDGTAEGEVTADADHALPRELGTKKMGARPFMEPAVEKVEPAFIAAMNALTEEAFQEFFGELDALGGDEPDEEDA